MENITSKQFKSTDLSRFSYVAKGKRPNAIHLPATLFLTIAIVGIFYMTVLKDGQDVMYASLMVGIALLPFFIGGIVLLVKLIIAYVSYASVSLAIYKNELYVRQKHGYVVYKREELLDVSSSVEGISSRQMRTHNVAPIKTDSGAVKIKTQHGEVAVQCRSLEKTIFVLNAFLENGNIAQAVEDYQLSYNTNFSSKLLDLASIFGTLCVLLIIGYTFFTAFKVDELVMIIALGMFGIGIFVFAFAGLLYVLISPQLKEGARQTEDARQSRQTEEAQQSGQEQTFAKPEQKPEQIMEQANRAKQVAKEISELCAKNIKNLIPFFIICLLASGGTIVAFCYGILSVITVAIIMFPLTALVIVFYIRCAWHIVTVKKIVERGSYCTARVIDFKLGMAGYGSLKLSYNNDKNETITKNTGYVYTCDVVQTASILENVEVKIYKNNVIVLTEGASKGSDADEEQV